MRQRQTEQTEKDEGKETKRNNRVSPKQELCSSSKEGSTEKCKWFVFVPEFMTRLVQLYGVP